MSYSPWIGTANRRRESLAARSVQTPATARRLRAQIASVGQAGSVRPPGLTQPAASARGASFAQVLTGAALRWDGAQPIGARPAAASSAAATQLSRVPGGFGPIIAEAAERYGIDPALIAGVIEAESNFNPNAVSGAGAKGLMQLMDATARGLGVSNSLDPRQNILGGAKFLSQMIERYGGDVSKALAAYNAGPGAVDRFGGIPPYAETQRYVPKVLAAMDRYRG